MRPPLAGAYSNTMVVFPELFSKRASAAWGRKAAELARFVNNSGRAKVRPEDDFDSMLMESARLTPPPLSWR